MKGDRLIQVALLFAGLGVTIAALGLVLVVAGVFVTEWGLCR